VGRDRRQQDFQGDVATVEAVLASSNAGKAAELREIFAGSPLVLHTPADLGVAALDVPENGRTYRANALAKARAYATQYSMPALGDDSGLAVRALGWRPGLYTARYGGPGLTPAQRVDVLLRELQGVPEEDREARFYCILVLAWPDARTVEGRGACSGVIATAPRGSGGFGYDPVFYLPALGLTTAELPSAVKHRLSHRGRAARSLLRALQRRSGIS
jgi:XTP/dITP diphosphohydrolase